MARIRNNSGRREMRETLKGRVVAVDPNSAARFAEMLPRAERRARLHELRKKTKRHNKQVNRHDLREQFPFRPVYGYVGGAR